MRPDPKGSHALQFFNKYTRDVTWISPKPDKLGCAFKRRKTGGVDQWMKIDLRYDTALPIPSSSFGPAPMTRMPEIGPFGMLPSPAVPAQTPEAE